MELSCRSSLLTHSPLSFFGQSVYLSLSFSHAPSSFCFGLSSTAQLSVIELAAELLPQLGHYPQLLRVPTSTSIRVPREAREPGIWHLLLIEPESLRRAMSAITRFAPKTTTTTNSFSCQGCLHTFGVALPACPAMWLFSARLLSLWAVSATSFIALPALPALLMTGREEALGEAFYRTPGCKQRQPEQ